MELRLGRREIYVRYVGMAASKLRIPAAKKGTARNMNTVAKLAAWQLLTSDLAQSLCRRHWARFKGRASARPWQTMNRLVTFVGECSRSHDGNAINRGD